MLPGALEQLLGGVEITGEDREVRPDAVAARAGRDGRLLGEPAGRAAVAGVQQRLDRVQRQALALGRLGGDAPRGEQEPDRADPGAAGALRAGGALELRAQVLVGAGVRLDAMVQRGVG